MPYTQTSCTRLSLVAAAALVGFLAFAGPAHASHITFPVNCVVSDATTCKTAGSFGTLTLDATTIQAQLALVTDSGSLVLRFDNHVHGEFDLDVDMCNLKGANGLVCAGFDILPTDPEFFGGPIAIEREADTAAMPVPEPASLVLLATGLLGAVRVVKGRAPKR